MEVNTPFRIPPKCYKVNGHRAHGTRSQMPQKECIFDAGERGSV